MMYLGETPAVAMVVSRKRSICSAEGSLRKTSKPSSFLETWSMTTATCQEHGQKLGKAKGNHGAQSPVEMGTTVVSACDVWCGAVATTGVLVCGAGQSLPAGFGGGGVTQGRCCKRRTVDGLR